MSLQNKLIAFFFLLTMVLSLVSFFIYQSGQQSISQYDDILQRFLILNAIAQTNHQLQHVFERYMLVPSEEHLTQYKLLKQELLFYQQQFAQTIGLDSVPSLSKNYYHMLSYLLDRMEGAFITLDSGDRQAHFLYRQDAEKASAWLNESTLRLINHELEDYHGFHYALLQQSQAHFTLGLVISMILFMLSLLFTYLFSKKITDPLRLLAEQAKALSSGNFQVEDVPVRTRDEIGLLSTVFNQMKKDIEHYIAQIRHKAAIEQELQAQKLKNAEMNHLLKEMSLRSLQNQMNPHFLFNTLNMVSKLAYMEGAQQTSDMIVSIAKLLRYHLKDLHTPATLADEVQQVRHYIDIQKCRFGERIKVNLDIEPSCLKQPVPPLTLQPLVENAFIHGLDGLEDGGQITIRARMRPDAVQVEVIDNGVGMSADQISQLLTLSEEQPNADHQGHTTGIGLRNVLKRLTLFYGQDQLLYIDAQPASGTRIVLTLPRTGTQHITAPDMPSLAKD